MRHSEKHPHTALSIAATALLAGTFAASAHADLAEAWGYNSNGQLGDGSRTTSTAPVAVVGMSSGVTAIVSGELHSVALQNGAVYAWGYNPDGQLGDGGTSQVFIPVPVNALTSGVTAIASGAMHSLALQNGAVYAWGANNYGQLGNGNASPATTAIVPVSGLSSGVTAIASGGFHSLAIKDGGVYAWGYDVVGEVGNGTTTTGMGGVDAPVAVTGLSSGVSAIAGGDFFSLAVKNGAAYAWGDGSFGQLGNGSTVNSSTPVAVNGLTNGVTAIAGGHYHSLAVKDGAVYAWGEDAYGQLGDGKPGYGGYDPVPKQIDPAQLTSIVAVSAAEYSSYALSADGSLWVWGYNGNGELGLGSTTWDYLTPQHLLPPTGYVFTSINSNSFGTHAVATLAAVPEPICLSLLAFAGLTQLRRRRS